MLSGFLTKILYFGSGCGKNFLSISVQAVNASMVGAHSNW